MQYRRSDVKVTCDYCCGNCEVKNVCIYSCVGRNIECTCCDYINEVLKKQEELLKGA
jgi:hypothetical protein